MRPQKKIPFIFLVSINLISVWQVNAQNSRGVLPDELTAEEILDGKYLWPESPEVDIQRVGQEKGFMPDAFGKAPAVGIHPRLLFSEEDIPKIQERIKNTRMGTKVLRQYEKAYCASECRRNGLLKYFKCPGSRRCGKSGCIAG